ncbi:MAG: PAS domain-containing protein [Alphaproteobacteria bacterium]|nr:PAS domain-containing protein [Alphaproteobacteria bacterium]
MSPLTRSATGSRPALPVLVAGIFLAGLGIYGFWRWAPSSPADAAGLLLCGVVPFALLAVLAARAVSGSGKAMLSTGYMNRIDQLQKRLNAQDDLVHSITDYAPSAMAIFNDKNEYWFVNATAAQNLGRDTAVILGKTPVALLGGETGRKIERHIDTARQTSAPVNFLRQETGPDNALRYIQAYYAPMAAIGDFTGGVISREEDVTSILVEHERAKGMLRQIISTLVAVVDRRDPYASGHSARVGGLARAMAAELQLSERDMDTAEIAGSLMNFGKVLVSRSILTKTGALTDAELQRIRDGIMTSADILSMIDFGMPVVPTLRQVLERFDGTGVPNRLAGESILMTARIVAVANAFIALVSPRAYRAGLDPLAAADRLAQDAGAFDPHVTAALQSYLHKNIGKLTWLVAVKQG